MKTVLNVKSRLLLAKDKLNSMNEIVLELQELLAQALVLNSRLEVWFTTWWWKCARDASKSEVNELLKDIIKLEGLLRTLLAQKRMSTVEVKTLDSQRQRLAGHLQTLRRKTLRFRARVITTVEDGFTEFLLPLITSMSSLMEACRRCIYNERNKCTAPLREVLIIWKHLM